MIKARKDMPSPLYDEKRLRDSRRMRRAVAGLGMLTLVLVIEAPVGERDLREPRAIGLLRGIMIAEELHFANHGSYDTLQCLASTDCIGSHGSVEGIYQGLIAKDVAALKDYHDYKLFFYSGSPSATPGKTPAATPLTDYAMVLVPKTAAKPTPKAFCGDRTGRIYVTGGTRHPRVENGRCLETSNPLQ